MLSEKIYFKFGNDCNEVDKKNKIIIRNLCVIINESVNEELTR